jgi:hypothetical protein
MESVEGDNYSFQVKNTAFKKRLRVSNTGHLLTLLMGEFGDSAKQDILNAILDIAFKRGQGEEVFNAKVLCQLFGMFSKQEAIAFDKEVLAKLEQRIQADRKKIVPIEGSRYSKNYYHVYFQRNLSDTQKIIEGAEPHSFVVLTDEKDAEYGINYAKEKSFIYCCNEQMETEKIDVPSFEIFPMKFFSEYDNRITIYAKDKNYAYFDSLKQQLNKQKLKKGNHCICFDFHKIKGSEAPSFEVYNGGERKYYDGKSSWDAFAGDN